MRYQPESGARCVPCPAPRSLVLALIGLLGGVGAAEAQEAGDPPRLTSADTLRPASSLRLRKTVIPSGEYLSRAIAAALERRAARVEVPQITVEIEPPLPENEAARYARRYGISQQLAQQIIDSALAEGIDPELGFRLVHTESRFKTRAHGPHGSLGLTQLMPSTARWLDRSLRTPDQIMEPGTNLRLGFRYLRQMIERYRGDLRLGLLAYNRGEGAVDRALRRGQDPENGYSRKVLGGRQSYQGNGLLPKN